jgi:hypothetical protein
VSVATEKRRQLRRQLIEEDLSHVVISKMTEAIKGNCKKRRRDKICFNAPLKIQQEQRHMN